MTDGDWLKGMRAFARMVAEELRKTNAQDEWVDQYRSPLCLPGQKSSKRHCSLVKQRIAKGLPGAFVSQDGKQFFLTTAALCEEMNGSRPTVVKAAPSEVTETIEVEDDGSRAMLSLLHGGRR